MAGAGGRAEGQWRRVSAVCERSASACIWTFTLPAGASFPWALCEATLILASLLTATPNQCENHSVSAHLSLSIHSLKSPRTLASLFRSGCYFTLSVALRHIVSALRAHVVPKHWITSAGYWAGCHHPGLSWCPNESPLAFIWGKKKRSCVIKFLLPLVLRTLRFLKYLFVQNYIHFFPFFP